MDASYITVVFSSLVVIMAFIGIMMIFAQGRELSQLERQVRSHAMKVKCSACGEVYDLFRRRQCPNCGYVPLPIDNPEEPCTTDDPSIEVDPDPTPKLGDRTLFDPFEPERTRIELDYARRLQTIQQDYVAQRLLAQNEYERKIRELQERED